MQRFVSGFSSLIDVYFKFRQLCIDNSVVSRCDPLFCQNPTQESNSDVSFGKPKLTLDNDFKESANGLEGTILLQVTINSEIQKMNFLSLDSNRMIVGKICQFLGYRHGSKINMQMRQEKMFRINKNSCRTILNKIISNEDLGTNNKKSKFIRLLKLNRSLLR